MIKLIPPHTFPRKPTEIHSYQDKSGQLWKMARTDDGIYIGYFGSMSLSPRMLIGKANTNFLSINDPSFEMFYDYRQLITQNFTDEVWEEIEEDILNTLAPYIFHVI